MIQISMIERGYMICKSAHPGSIPGVASNHFKEYQGDTICLDVTGARVAQGAWDKIRDSVILTAIFLMFSTPSLAQQQGGPATPQAWVSATEIGVIAEQPYAAVYPGAVFNDNSKTGFTTPLSWKEADLTAWGVPSDAKAVQMQCEMLSTPRGMTFGTLAPDGNTVNVGQNFTLWVYMAAANDTLATCSGTGTKYLAKAVFARGGGTRIPFYATVPVSNGKIKHCHGVAYPAGVATYANGGPSYVYGCQPVVWFR